MIINWQNTFDSRKKPCIDIYDASIQAKDAGYVFFWYNETIWITSKIWPTDVKAADLDKGVEVTVDMGD